MKSSYFIFFIVLSIAISCIGFNTGCSTVKVDSAAVTTKNETSPDPEIRNALAQIEKSPDSAAGYDRLAIIYIRRARATGDFGLNAKAQTAIEKALEVAPDDSQSRKLRASLDLTFHRFGDALNAGKQLEKDFPNDEFVYGVLTDANAELGNYDAAVDAAQKMVDLKPNMASYARIGHLRSLYGDTEGAIAQLKTAARTADPMDKEAQSWCLVQLGDELLKNGRYSEAEKAYDEALQNFPNYHLALAGKGRARAVQGDLETAEKILTDANNRVPNVETTILLGDIYTKLGDAEKAKQQYDLVEIIEQKIGLNNDRKRLALLWAAHETQLDEALEIASREYKDRTDILTADALAWCLYKKGNPTDAKTAITAAMRLKTKDARILYHAGMIEKGLGNRREAQRLLTAALKLNPAFDLLQADEAKKALSELK